MEVRGERHASPPGPPPPFSACYHHLHRQPPPPSFIAPPPHPAAAAAAAAAAMRHIAATSPPPPPIQPAFPPDPPPIGLASMAHHPAIPPAPPPPPITMMAITPIPTPARLHDPVKRKRGRPRKYEATDANGAGGGGRMALGLATSTSLGSPAPEKRGRGSGKKAQLAALGAAGQCFTPHIVRVAAGEDVAIKIMSFLQHGPWAVCVLLANGAISNVTLRQPFLSGGTVTYEGRYEIITLTGLFLATECGGSYNRTGGLSISLAGTDGCFVGGGVAGLLVAATPVLVILGTFFPESRKKQVHHGISESQPSMSLTGSAGALLPSLQMASLVHEDITGSIRDHFSGAADGENPQQQRMSHVMPFHSIDWTGTHFESEARDDTDTVVPSSPGGS